MKQLKTRALPGHIADSILELVRKKLQGVRVDEKEFNRLACEPEDATVILHALHIELDYVLECDPKGDII